MTQVSPPPGRSFRIVLLTTFAAFAAFYAPQPLLPFFADAFDTGPSEAGLLLTVCFAALAIAPLGIGALLERWPAQRLLLFATAALGLLQFAFAAAGSFEALLGARVLQALLYPAIFTAAVTWCSRAPDPGAIARRVSTYVATTILGGLSGRLIGGLVSDALGWRTTFVLLGALLLLCALALTRAARDQSVRAPGGSLRASLAILREPGVAAGYALIALAFFTFSGLLNALPFRVVALDADVAPGTISLVYLGYLIGIVIALNIARLTRVAGSPARAMAIALAVFAVGLVASGVPNVTVLIAAGFLTSAGLFTVHATLSGTLNALLPDRSSLVNGLYIAIYYAAGALGSLLPLALFERNGWRPTLALLLGTCVAAAWPLWRLSRRLGTSAGTADERA